MPGLSGRILESCEYGLPASGAATRACMGTVFCVASRYIYVYDVLVTAVEARRRVATQLTISVTREQSRLALAWDPDWSVPRHIPRANRPRVASVHRLSDRACLVGSTERAARDCLACWLCSGEPRLGCRRPLIINVLGCCAQWTHAGAASRTPSLTPPGNEPRRGKCHCSAHHTNLLPEPVDIRVTRQDLRQSEAALFPAGRDRTRAILDQVGQARVQAVRGCLANL